MVYPLFYPQSLKEARGKQKTPLQQVLLAHGLISPAVFKSLSNFPLFYLGGIYILSQVKGASKFKRPPTVKRPQFRRSSSPFSPP